MFLFSPVIYFNCCGIRCEVKRKAQIRWMDSVKSVLTERNVEQVKMIVHDRSEWKAEVNV